MVYVFQVITVAAYVLSFLSMFAEKGDKKWIYPAVAAGLLFVLSELVERLLP